MAHARRVAEAGKGDKDRGTAEEVRTRSDKYDNIDWGVGKTIYRCGYCGFPCNDKGEPLRVDAAEYLHKYRGAEVEHVHGFCCEDQWREPEIIGYVTREMATDAGEPDMEGQPVYG